MAGLELSLIDRLEFSFHLRSCPHYLRWSSRTAASDFLPQTNGISRFSRLKFPHMHQVFDSVASAGCSPACAPNGVAFRHLNDVGTRNENSFGAQYWACVCPCRCYTQRVTTISVRLRASVPGWGFAVRLFHSQLQAGLSRRFSGLFFEATYGKWEEGDVRGIECSVWSSLR